MSNIPGTRDPYLNEYFTKHEYGDFTPFYVTITICSVIVLVLLLLNFVFCCCSEHTGYWCDINTGNRYIIPVWTRTPHKQPALDYSELEGYEPPPAPVYDYPEPTHSIASTTGYSTSAFAEREHRPQQYYGASVPKRESDI